MKIPMKFSPEMRRVALMTMVKHAGKITRRAAHFRAADGCWMAPLDGWRAADRSRTRRAVYVIVPLIVQERNDG